MIIPAIGYLTGILTIRALHLFQVPLRYHNDALIPAAFICMGGFLCFCLLPRFSLLRFPKVYYALSVAALFFTGAWCYTKQNHLVALPQNSKPTLCYGKVERVTLTKSERFMRINTRLLAYRQGGESTQCNINIFIYIPIECYDPRLQAGSKIMTVSRIQHAAQDNATSDQDDLSPVRHKRPLMRYKLQPVKNNLPPSIFLSQANPLAFSHVSPSLPARISGGLLTKLKTNIQDPDAYALIAGLSTGNKEAFDPELRSAYAGAGASHVLAVSGLHIGIIYAIVHSICNIFILGNKRPKRLIKQLLTLAAITFFAAITQFTPSVTRALLMVALSITGSAVRRSTPPLQTLFATALLINIINPSAIFEVSFQLSFCAVLAILAIQPPLERLWHPKTKAEKYVWSLTCVSIAAQAGTAPLAYHYFGTFPYLFLLTNLIVVPLTGILLYLLCAWLVLGNLPVVGNALLWAMEQTAGIMNWGVVWIDKLV